jgi:diacylglycerol kinase (ATP)
MWLVAINPTSGRGRGAKLGQEVSNYLQERKINYQIITGANAVALQNNLRQSIETLKSNSIQIRAIIAVGGDGLIHLALQIAVPHSIAVVTIPAGTGNDFVRSLGWDLDRPLAPLWTAINSAPQDVDLGEIDGEYFAAIASTGFDSLVNERANGLSWPKGPAKYNVAMAIELPKFKPLSYKFTIDGKYFEREAMLIAVGNGRSYGGGMLVCPDAELDDGQFDLMILNPVSKREFIRIFPSVYEGAHISHPKVEIHKASEIGIEASAICYADGERIGPMPATFHVAKGALKTWRP